jgi:hypothetical protein
MWDCCLNRFHVDDLSSAHVYLRLKPDQRLEDVSQETIDECAQLVKANSIEGCKKHEVYVIYTRWRNLHKTNDMQVGKYESTVYHADKYPSIHTNSSHLSCALRKPTRWGPSGTTIGRKCGA